MSGCVINSPSAHSMEMVEVSMPPPYISYMVQQKARLVGVYEEQIGKTFQSPKCGRLVLETRKKLFSSQVVCGCWLPLKRDAYNLKLYLTHPTRRKVEHRSRMRLANPRYRLGESLKATCHMGV
ncbi:hypothetical protein GOP47_0018153 [Adiantum capillus-veneris]|uniref:Uncharacterized protein n=1 Tax=Adiantum capillus-veneris TaxID=13818 RepID=A0A9D4UGU0_ADICA|nr:hypothetical protein GOP47_0018153 [Adiantum capillus-veneris]